MASYTPPPTSNYRSKEMTCVGSRTCPISSHAKPSEDILYVLSEAFTPEQWAYLLKNALERAETKGDRGLAKKLMRQGRR